MYDVKFRDMVCKEYIETNITRKEICKKYDIKLETFKCWLKRYYGVNLTNDGHYKYKGNDSLVDNNDYKDMTKEQLQIELIKKDFEIERLKKNYQVIINPITGKKEFISLSN